MHEAYATDFSEEFAILRILLHKGVLHCNSSLYVRSCMYMNYVKILSYIQASENMYVLAS